MTLLDARDAEIVRLCRVEGATVRTAAATVRCSIGTVSNVVNRFCDELAVFIGPLSRKTPGDLRDITIHVLANAEAVRAARRN